MADYIDVKGVYGDKFFSGSFTLPMIASAIRALVLERHGGIWMDADTILAGRDIEKYLYSEKDVIFFGNSDCSSVHVAWICAKKRAKLLEYWVSQCDCTMSNILMELTR